MKRSFSIALAIAFLAITVSLGATSTRADASGGWYDCYTGAVYNTTTGKCADNSMPRFHPDSIQLFVPRMVPHLTRAQLKALDAELDRQAAALAKQWSRNGRLNAAQLQQLKSQACLLVAAKNPDVTCVPR